MILPKIGNIYRYKDKEIGIIDQILLLYIYGLEYSNNSCECSTFKQFNWIDFALNAKYVRKIKPDNNVY